MTKLIIIFLNFFIGSSFLLSGQESLTWFKASSIDNQDISNEKDCLYNETSASNASTYSKEFSAQPLFVYTHPQVRQYLDKKFLLEASAYVQKVDKNEFLIIKYKINSKQAKTNYGNLEKGSKIKVKLLENGHIYLENIERDRGRIKKSDDYTIYTGTYALSKDNSNELKKHSIDKITVLWEEGVEEYEIQNIDLVKNQLKCLND